MFNIFKSKSDKILKKLDALDLSSVIYNLVEKSLWTRDKALSMAKEYKQFLYLVATNPNKSVVPWTQELDDFWHQHILDTKKYHDDCYEIFGRIIHHDPNTTLNPDKHLTAWEDTKKMYSNFHSSMRNDSSNYSNVNRDSDSWVWLVPIMMMDSTSCSSSYNDKSDSSSNSSSSSCATHCSSSSSSSHDSTSHSGSSCSSHSSCSSSHSSCSSSSSGSSCSSSSCSSSSCGSSCST